MRETLLLAGRKAASAILCVPRCQLESSLRLTAAAPAVSSSPERRPHLSVTVCFPALRAVRRRAKAYRHLSGAWLLSRETRISKMLLPEQMKKKKTLVEALEPRRSGTLRHCPETLWRETYCKSDSHTGGPEGLRGNRMSGQKVSDSSSVRTLAACAHSATDWVCFHLVLMGF